VASAGDGHRSFVARPRALILIESRFAAELRRERGRHVQGNALIVRGKCVFGLCREKPVRSQLEKSDKCDDQLSQVPSSHIAFLLLRTAPTYVQCEASCIFVCITLSKNWGGCPYLGYRYTRSSVRIMLALIKQWSKGQHTLP
jgi:hypothetical protein